MWSAKSHQKPGYFLIKSCNINRESDDIAVIPALLQRTPYFKLLYPHVSGHSFYPVLLVDDKWRKGNVTSVCHQQGSKMKGVDPLEPFNMTALGHANQISWVVRCCWRVSHNSRTLVPIGLEKSTELSRASQGQVRNDAADLARAFLPRLRISRGKAPAKERYSTC